MNVLFSVIIPTYNRAQLLRSSITTALQQQYRHFEILIVDDGSTDNTAEVVKEIIAASPIKITYIYQENSERSVARNRGLKSSSGDYVCFFDSDDALYTNHLQVANDYIVSHNSPEFLHLRYDVKNNKGEITSESGVYSEFPNRKLISGNFLSCNGVFLRRDVALLHQFNENRKLSTMEDWELWLRISAEYPLHYINTITSSVINHDERSVLNVKRDSLVNSVMLMLQLVTNNDHVMTYFAGNIHKLKSSCYSYVSLHLALTGKYKKDAIHFLFKSLVQRPSFVFQRRFFAIIKHLL